MDQLLKSKEFILREVALVHFLNEIISNKEWHVRIDDSINTLTVDGDSSPQVQYNALLQTIIWTNLTAEPFKIKSGVLQFDRTFTSCHGHVTTGSNLEFLVESVATSEPNSLQSTYLSAPPAYYAEDPQYALSAQVDSLELNSASQSAQAAPVVPVEHWQDQLKQLALYVINQASQEVSLASSQSSETTEISKQAISDVYPAVATPNPAVLDPKEILDDATLLKTMSTSTVAMTRYTTHKRPKGSTDEEDWDDGPQFGVGVEQQPALRTFVYLGENDITNFVTISGDQDQYTKAAGVATHPDKSGFEIAFGGFGKEKTFTGTYYKGSKEFEWKGGSPTISYVDREGNNKPVVGSDGLTLNALLYSITNLGKTKEDGKSVDLAQKEADNILGRLLQGFAGLHTELSALGTALKAVFVQGSAQQKIKDIFAPMARWVYKIGGALITGIREFASYVAKGVKSGLMTAYETTVGRAVTFLKNTIVWGKVFNVLCNVLSFCLSVLCCALAVSDCITAWKSGRPIDIVTSTISAVLVGLEVITMVVSGLAWLSGAEATVSACSTFGMALGVAGIIFAVVLIIYTLTTYEDPLDTLVEKYGKKYGLLN